MTLHFELGKMPTDVEIFNFIVFKNTSSKISDNYTRINKLNKVLFNNAIPRKIKYLQK